MPHVDAFTLELVDRALRVAGTLLFAIAALRLVRTGRWRNPLSQIEFGGGGPTLAHLVGVTAIFYLILFVGTQASGIDSEAMKTPGSRDWHVARCIEDGAEVVASILIVVILRRCGAPYRGAVGCRTGIWTVLSVGGTGVLIILAITNVQLQAGQVVWHWLQPEAQQPIHSVLEALEHTAWGTWGTVQLTIAAIIIAPLAEELFFRGLLLQTLWGYTGHAWPAIALSGVAFGLIHNQQPQDVLPLATMGAILGYVRVRYRSLPACMLIHALFNGRTMLFVLLCPEAARIGW